MKNIIEVNDKLAYRLYDNIVQDLVDFRHYCQGSNKVQPQPDRTLKGTLQYTGQLLYITAQLTNALSQASTLKAFFKGEVTWIDVAFTAAKMTVYRQSLVECDLDIKHPSLVYFLTRAEGYHRQIEFILTGGGAVCQMSKESI